MGAFPNLSRNVPFCPRLSSFVLLGARNGDKSGQKRTNRDKTGHFGTNWETPPFSIYPHLALLKISRFLSLVVVEIVLNQTCSNLWLPLIVQPSSQRGVWPFSGTGSPLLPVELPFPSLLAGTGRPLSLLELPSPSPSLSLFFLFFIFFFSLSLLRCCERVLHFMGREATGR